jgi:hypothetical protein
LAKCAQGKIEAEITVHAPTNVDETFWKFLFFRGAFPNN